jgi:hypothetical protein
MSKVILLACGDSRLHIVDGNGVSQMAKLCLEKGYELFPAPWPGGVMSLVRATSSRARDGILYQVDFYATHGAKKIVLVNHEDCLAYRGAGITNGTTREQEICLHMEDLEIASDILASEFGLPVVKYFGLLSVGSRDVFSFHDTTKGIEL